MAPTQMFDPWTSVACLRVRFIKGGFNRSTGVTFLFELHRKEEVKTYGNVTFKLQIQTEKN